MQRCPLFRMDLLFHMRNRCCFDQFFHGCLRWPLLHSGLGSEYDPGFWVGSGSSGSWIVCILTIGYI